MTVQIQLLANETNRTFTPAEMVTTGNVVIYSLEAVLLIIGFALNLTFFVALFRTRLLHTNLRFLLKHLCLSIFVYTVSRYAIFVPLMVAYHTDKDISSMAFCYMAKLTHDFLIVIINTAFVNMVIERTIATYLVSNYESVTSQKIGFILCSCQWLVSAATTIWGHVDVLGVNWSLPILPCQHEYSTGYVMGIMLCMGIVTNIASLFGLVKILRINTALYKLSTSQNIPCLGERYQVSENVRATRLLTPMLLTLLGFTMLFSLCLSFTIFVAVQLEDGASKSELKSIMKLAGGGGEMMQMTDVSLALMFIAFGVTPRFHPHLYRNFGFCWQQPSEKKRRPIEGLDGKPLKMSSEKETDHHFETLKSVWG